ncbi:BglG family transcription antiterminator [Neobacillus jeddahensis]|uniref:BglG family transcription antiterminator n=1 Tax=Neobacillus jeddahensis TaxID=1461580 RepID=UPI0005901953|nr:HTH domain-containing protein [Neobacillus jeddahensis]
MLTSREIQIVTKLLEAEKTLRTKDLSTELNVSTRTIKSDLEQVRKWFTDHGIELCSQPNRGYWIECSENNRLKLYKTLMEMESKSLYPDQNIRIEKILYLFFSQNGYVTAARIADYLQVSRNTVISDLNFLEDYIKPWMIELERMPRTGYKIVGEEIHIRLLFEHIIQESLSNFDLYKIISTLKSGGTDEINIGFTQEIQTKFEKVIQYIHLILKDKRFEAVSHAEIVSIFIRLIIFLVRLESEFTIGSYRLLKNNQHIGSLSSKFILNVMTKICEEFDFPILEDEFLYVHRNFLLEDKELNLLTITEELIRSVSKKEGIPYDKDTRLFNNLLTHLSLRFEKNKTYVTEVNPFKNEIKRNNASLFSSIKEACEKLFGKNTKVVQDSFLSFIALHFLVSYENVFDKKPKIRALYVCSTGRGVARLIKNRVEREIGEINITRYCSVMEVDEISKNEDIDLIVSIFPIKSSIPVILVEPVPTEENILAIREKVNELRRGKVAGEDLTIENDDGHSLVMDYEMISQEIIVKGFEISNEIFSMLAGKMTEERKMGLHVHLFLMVHRYYFHKQYDQFIHQTKDDHDEQLLHQINEILIRHRIFINETELIALLPYFQ